MDNKQLLKAVDSEDIDGVKLALSQGDEIEGVHGFALRNALLKGNNAIAQLLVSSDLASVNLLDGEALRLAAHEGHTDIVNTLLNAGANPNARREDEHSLETPMSAACANGHLDAVKALFAHGATIPLTDLNPVASACANGHKEVLEYLIERGAPLTVKSYLLGYETTINPLNLAAENGHAPIVEMLLAKGIPTEDDELNPLVNAAGNGHLACVKLLAEAGADLHAEGDGAIRFAAIRGHSDITQYLIEDRGMKIEPATKEWLKNNHCVHALKVLSAREMSEKMSKPHPMQTGPAITRNL